MHTQPNLSFAYLYNLYTFYSKILLLNLIAAQGGTKLYKNRGMSMFINFKLHFSTNMKIILLLTKQGALSLILSVGGLKKCFLVRAVV